MAFLEFVTLTFLFTVMFAVAKMRKIVERSCELHRVPASIGNPHRAYNPTNFLGVLVPR